VAFAEAERARRETAARQRETQVARLSERAANLRAAIQGRAGTEERLADTEARLARAREDLARWRAKADALLRLEAALEAADAALRARVHAPLRAELAPLLRLVMAAPAELVLDDATLAPAGLARDGVTTAREALSGGEQEQVAILTRLAFAALMARGGEAPAVILDDALAHSDDARLDRMFAAIGSLADRLQILVLSCHRRAFAALGGALLEPVPWRPDPD
jgi:DNA repair exonuclease SbcCD ATPase subunit